MDVVRKGLRSVRDVGVAGSNPVTPTIDFIHFFLTTDLKVSTLCSSLRASGVRASFTALNVAPRPVGFHPRVWSGSCRDYSLTIGNGDSGCVRNLSRVNCTRRR